MAQKKVTKQSVRKSNRQLREEKERQQAQRRRIIGGIIIGVLVIIAAIFLWQSLGLGTDDDEGMPLADDIESRPLADVEPADREGFYAEYPAMVLDADKSYEAVIQTNKGDMRIRLFDDEAPMTVNNFVYLANEGFYDGLTFHRVIADFMAQGGDPTGIGAGGPGYQFVDETDNTLRFDKPGLLAMANSGPNTNGSQFFITSVPTPHLNGLHTIFGELIEGEDVLLSLEKVQPGQIGSSGSNADIIERIIIVES